MADISELRLIKGVDEEIYAKLIPYLIALPEKTTLNLNTISAEVFDSLDLKIDSQAFISEREKDAFSSIDDFSKRLEVVLDAEQKADLAVTSNYFVASGVVTLGEKSVGLNSLMYRSKDGLTTVVARNLGDGL